MSTSTTTKTVAASTAAALLIAGGVALFNSSDSNSTSTGTSGIDWSLYELNVPTIVLPTIDVPTISVPKIAVTTIKIDDLSSDTSIKTPGLTTETVKIDSINTSSISTPVITGTEVTLPVLDTNTFVDISISSMTKNINKDIEGINKSLLGLKLDDPSADLPEWMAFVQDTQSIFIDKRMMRYDKTFIKTNTIIGDWIKIYKDFENAPDVKYVPIREKFRMITEVRIPKNLKQLEILTENLKYYKSEGYDSILVAFTQEDNPYDVLNTIKYIIKNSEMKVWATYTGKETLHDSVFMDVVKYKEILETIAPYLHGYVNSWRRTSSHLWAQDQQFMKYTNTILRSVSPNLPIIGELYYGNTHKYDTVGNIGFEMNNFKNSSAIMIVNFGFKRIDVNYLFDTVLKPYIGNTPTVACVVGHKPYYLTRNRNNLDYKQNMKIKHEVEDKFLTKGCVGVVTLSNDGRELESNNLSETLYNTLQ